VGSQFIPGEGFTTLGLCYVKVNTWVLTWGKKLLEKPKLFTCDVQYIVFSTGAMCSTLCSVQERCAVHCVQYRSDMTDEAKYSVNAYDRSLCVILTSFWTSTLVSAAFSKCCILACDFTAFFM